MNAVPAPQGLVPEILQQAVTHGVENAADRILGQSGHGNHGGDGIASGLVSNLESGLGSELGSGGIGSGLLGGGHRSGILGGGL